MAEPDVALTDFALGVEAALLAVLARRLAIRAWVVFFGAVAIAALAGGLTHGFFPDERSAAGMALWRATLIALGVTAAAAVGAGAQPLLGGRRAVYATNAAIAVAVVYAAVVVFVTDAFAGAIVMYLPATLFLLAVFTVLHARTRSRRTLAGATGLVVLLVGSWVQWRGIAGFGLSYNALYHVIEMIALPLVYCGARGVAPRGGSACSRDVSS